MLVCVSLYAGVCIGCMLVCVNLCDFLFVSVLVCVIVRVRASVC